jgi:hypothetical protein
MRRLTNIANTCLSSDLSIEKKYRQHLFISEMDESENRLLTIERMLLTKYGHNLLKVPATSTAYL